MPAVAGLVTLAICLQKKYVIQGNAGYFEPLSLYSVIIAKPAVRKSSILEAMTKYIYQYEKERNAELQGQINECEISKNILTKQIKELEERAGKGVGDFKKFREQAIEKKNELSQMKEVKQLRLIADDTSPEALTSLLSENNGKMSIVSAEGGIFDILAGRYSSGVNIDTFLKGHAGDSLRVDRRGRPSEIISNPALSVLLTIQPSVLEGIMANEAFRGRGLCGRFLYSIPVSKVGYRIYNSSAIPFEYEQDYKELIFSLLKLPENKKPQIIKLSEGAKEVIAVNFKALEPRLVNDLESISEWAGKFIGCILRIAGLIHIAEYKSSEIPVSEQTMKNAVTIGNYFLEHSKLAYSIMGADEQQQSAKYVLKQLQKAYYSELSKRDIFNLCRGKLKKADELEPVIEMLIDYGYVQLVPVPEREGAGRKPSPIYKINPYLYTQIEQIE